MKTKTNQISSKITLTVCALFAMLAILAAPGAFAVNGPDTWTGNTSANLGDAGNWTGVNNPPLAGDSWVFGAANATSGAALVDSFSGGITVSNILFNGPGAFTFTGNAITLAGTITNASTALQTFNLPMSITATPYTTLTVTAGGGDINIGGAISGTTALNLAGAGNVILTNDNTGFSGSLTNGPGVTLTISGAGALGAGSAGTYVWPNSALFTNFGVVVYSSSATNTFGPKCDGPGSLIINGPGEFISSPQSSWGMTGNITVNGGIFSDQKPYPGNGRSGFGATTPTINAGRTVTVNGTGIVSLDATYAFGQIQTPLFFHNLVFIANTNGLLRIAASDCVFSNILINGGTVFASNNTFQMEPFASIITGGTLPSYMTALASGNGFNLGSSSSAGYQVPFVVNPTVGGSGAGGADLIVSAAMQNSGLNGTATGFTLGGGGTMLMSGTNTFTGPISVNAGTLILGDAGTLASNFPGAITIASGATFIINTSLPQTNTGVMSGAGTLALAGSTLYLAGTASTVSPLTLAISNGATLDVTQLTNGTTLGSTIMGFGTINGNVNASSGALIEAGIPGTPATLPVNGNVTMGGGADFSLAITDSASSPNNASIAVTGILTLNGTQIHLTAPSGQDLDTQNYTLITTTGGVVGSVSPGVIWDVAPANANYYYITNINNNIVLYYSTTPIPTPGGVTSPANILRNGTALLIVTVVPGINPVTNVTVNASSVGGSSALALAPNGALNTWTNSVYIGPAIAPGVYLLPATATDTTPITGNGIVALSVIASTETWAGSGTDQKFDTAANWAVESGQTAPYPPAYAGDLLVFAGTANLAPVMDNSYTVNSLGFASGAGAFNITASGTNVLTLMGGVTNLSASSETLNLPVLSGLAGPQTVSAANGNLTLSGGFADKNGGLTVTGSSNFTLAGNSTFTGPLAVRKGAMTLTGSLTNTNDVHVADLGASVATLNVGSGGSLAVTNGHNVVLGAGANSVAVMTLGPGGSLTATNGELIVGNGNNSSEYFNMTGGTAYIGYNVFVGQFGDHARFDMSGGTFTMTSNLMRIATETGQVNQFGEANFSGGTFNSLNQESIAGEGGGMFVGETGVGVLNVSGTAVLNIWGDTNLVLGVVTTPYLTTYEAAGNGTVNLLGGAIVTAQVAGGTGTNSVFNFNGGLLSNYAGTINWITGSAGPAFMYNLSNAYVYPGGAFIDDGGGNIVVNQALQAPSGYGVSSIVPKAKGSGYIAPPYVIITGGAGTGATASAVVSGGQVTAINVTCPGTGYASGDTLTVTLVGGGGTGATATNAPVVLNGSGGLTYSSQAGTGNGMLTLTAPATYTNATIIKNGTLSLGTGGSISKSAAFIISNGAILDGSQVGGFNLGNNQTIEGFGTVNGLLIAGSGSRIYPGVDPAVGTLTMNAGLNMQIGSIATFNLTNSGLSGASNDQVVVNGGSRSLNFANNTIHIKSINGAALDAVNAYTLFQNNSSALVGLPNPAPVFDVAPANQGTGHWLIQPQGYNIVLMNSATAPPTGTGSITAGAIGTPATNVIRNTSINISVTAATAVSVSLDLTAYSGSQYTFTPGSGGTWTATGVAIPPGMPPGPTTLPIVIYDGTLYNEIALPVGVLATTDVWSGADFGTSQVVDDNANWQLDQVNVHAAPGYVGDSVIFAGTAGLTPIFEQYYTFNGIGFASGAGPFILSSSAGSVSVTGGITNNSANVESVNLPLTLTGANEFFEGASSGTLLLSNTVSGAGQLNVAAGAGGVTLDGTVSYTGNTFIASGGSLIMGATGQWQDINDNMSYPGAMTNNGTFIYNSTQTYQTNAGIISGSGSMIVNGPGTLVANAANSFTNGVVVNGGVISDLYEVGTAGTSGFGSTAIDGRTVTINNGGIASLDGAGGNEFGNGTTLHNLTFVVNTNGLLRITSGNVVFTNIVLNGGTTLAAPTSSILTSQWGNFDLAASIIVGGNRPSTMAGIGPGTPALAIGYCLGVNAATNYQTPFVVASTGSSGPDLVVPASLFNSDNTQNPTGIKKTGAGTMALTGTNFFTGPITVGNGILLLGGAGVLNGPTNAAAQPTAYPGNIIISNGATFAFGTSQLQTNSGVISGAGTLMVTNGSSMYLSNAASTLTGTVSINSGTLFLVSGASFVGPSTISIAGGATFDVSQLTSPYVWPAGASVTGSGGAGSPATINSAGAVTIGSSSSIILNNYDGTDPGLAINGSLTLGGANAFVVNGAPLANGQYNLIYASGGITDPAGYPAVTGTAIGPTSQGSIAVNGNYVVLTVSSVNVNAPPIQFSLSGKVLTLSWPTNAGWTLQSNSINVAVPGDWFSIPGSSGVTTFPINIGTATTNVFYRLYLP
jgi:autotransporter-associated beta strand protein